MKRDTLNHLEVEGNHAKYPLRDFLGESTFQNIVKSLQHDILKSPAARPGQKGESTSSPQKPGKRPDPSHSSPDSIYREMSQLLDGVYLCKFHSTVAFRKPSLLVHQDPRKRRPQTIYIYDIGLDSDKRVGLLLKNPLDTVLAFGRKVEFPDIDLQALLRFDAYWRNQDSFALKDESTKVPKPGKHPGQNHKTLCDLNLRLILKANGVLDTLQIYGPGIEIYFSKKLVRPMLKTSRGTYKATGNRVKVNLENRIITITRGFPPRLSRSLIFENNVVQIGQLNQLARLKEVTLGGTFKEPKLIFTDLEFLTG
jgi:hypothetical protein